MNYDKLSKPYLMITGVFLLITGVVGIFMTYDVDTTQPPQSLTDWAALMTLWGFSAFCVYNGLHRLNRSNR